MPIGSGVLEYTAKNSAGIEFFGSPNNNIDIEGFSTGFHDRNILWMTVLVDKKSTGFRLSHALGHNHGLGRCSRFIEQRRIGNF